MISDGAFPKTERLIKTKDFGNVYKKGSSVKFDVFVLRVLPNTLPVNRLGFSISTRSVKKASARNRIRRLFREAYRLHKSAVKKGFDMVLVVRKEAPEKFCYKDAAKIFLLLAQKAGVLS